MAIITNEEEMEKREIKIALVDDHTLFRTGLKGLLSGREDFKVVADFGSGVEFLKHLPQLDVDVVFMDLEHGAFLVAQTVKHLPAMRETWV